MALLLPAAAKTKTHVYFKNEFCCHVSCIILVYETVNCDSSIMEVRYGAFVVGFVVVVLG